MLLAGSAARAELEGNFEGDFGPLEVASAPSGEVWARGQGGKCRFTSNRELLRGELEGDVLVGTVLVCQSGSGCGERKLPFLAFYNEAEGRLVADVRLESGCTSEALGQGRLVLQRTPMRVGLDSAEATEESPDARLERAEKALTDHRLEEARREASQVLRSQPTSVRALNLVGMAELAGRRPDRALVFFERAREVDSSVWGTFYNLACAHAARGENSQAIDDLRRAVERGYLGADYLAKDPDLALLRKEPEFEELIERVRLQETQGGVRERQ